MPSASAAVLLIRTMAAAPSAICDDVPAVIVPDLANTGRRAASVSTVVEARSPSSTEMSVGPPRPAIDHGAIGNGAIFNACTATPARASTAEIACAPSSVAGTDANAPLNFTKEVRA
ncbi:hypothetical protein IWX88_001462 [Frigoribacterium sp. CG_9.8]|nr:hypothetical protein [Frigoribacterium sp. CG_9.8]